MTMYALEPESISKAVAEVEAYLEEKQVDKKEALRISLQVEDALLRFSECYEVQRNFELKCGKSLGKLRITVSVKGEMFDPFRRNNDDENVDSFMRQALASMGDMPTWRYSMGTNIVAFALTRKSVPDLVHLLIAIIAAVVAGFLIPHLPANVGSFLIDGVLDPALGTFMDFLGAMAGPMIFLAVVWGIYSIGDAATFSALGKRLLSRYVLLIVILTLAFGFAILPFFDLIEGSTTSEFGSSFSPIFEMVLGIVPGNLFTPFTEGNTLQILFVGIIVGLAMLFASEKTQTVAMLMEQVSIIVQIIMDAISKLVPFFVFGSLLDIITTEDFSQISQSYKLIFANVGGCFALLVIYVVYVAVRTNVSPFVFIKKALPTFLIGMTTASSAAAFATSRKTCSDEYGIEPRLADFGVPFGQVIYKPSVALLYLSSAICTAEIFGVTVSASWLVSAFAMSAILSIATPPIPGGQLASYTVLFAQLAIPDAGIALVLAIGILLDFLETPTDLVGGHSMLILAANKFRMIDLETFRKSNVVPKKN